MNEDTWKPYNTDQILAQTISDYNKSKDKKDILMSYSIIGFCVMDNFEIHFPSRKGDKRNRRFVVEYRHSKNFLQRLLSLFKKEEGHYEIYTEQEGF